MRNRLVFPLLVVGTIAITAPLAAHHSFSMEFDLTKPIFMDGTITKVLWQNPHVEFFIDVRNKETGTVSWDIEINAPHYLLDNGWKKDTLVAGMDVCVEGFPATTGKPKLGSTSITIQSTKRVLRTPAGGWVSVRERELASKAIVSDPITYTGRTSCANRDAR